MANMSYCRWQNTLDDLQDCYDHLFDDDLSPEEDRARRQLIHLCGEIFNESGGDEAEDDDE